MDNPISKRHTSKSGLDDGHGDNVLGCILFVYEDGPSIRFKSLT